MDIINREKSELQNGTNIFGYYKIDLQENLINENDRLNCTESTWGVKTTHIILVY